MDRGDRRTGRSVLDRDDGSELVADAVARVITEVLGTTVAHRLVDENGNEWNGDVAREQLTRLREEPVYPRRLTNEERAVLDALLCQEFPGAEALRRQAMSVVVTARCDCGCPSVDLAVQDLAALLWIDKAGRAHGERQVPVHGQSVSSDDSFDVMLWVEDGRLSLMEFVGPAQRHSTWPGPVAFEFWTA